MIEWEDEGIVLNARVHGDTGKIIALLTQSHGLVRGFLPGGQSKRKAAILQIGTIVNGIWSSRLEDQLGRYQLEASYQPQAFILHDPLALQAMRSACHLTEFSIVERLPLRAFYEAFKILLEGFGEEFWPILYLKWEFCLLDALGFGLDLTKCAVTGRVENLVAVSPNTGRAVSKEAAEPYLDKLLPFPHCLKNGEGSWEDILEGLKLTGHFLEKSVFHPANKPLPEMRGRLVEMIHKKVDS